MNEILRSFVLSLFSYPSCIIWILIFLPLVTTLLTQVISMYQSTDEEISFLSFFAPPDFLEISTKWIYILRTINVLSVFAFVFLVRAIYTSMDWYFNKTSLSNEAPSKLSHWSLISGIITSISLIIRYCTPNNVLHHIILSISYFSLLVFHRFFDKYARIRHFEEIDLSDCMFYSNCVLIPAYSILYAMHMHTRLHDLLVFFTGLMHYGITTIFAAKYIIIGRDLYGDDFYRIQRTRNTSRRFPSYVP